MRLVRILLGVLFIVSVVLFVFSEVTQIGKTDQTIPEIKCGEDTVTISVADDASLLLQGVTASDEKDGDLTSEIYIDSYGPVAEDGTSYATLAVCDKDGHVAKFKRSIAYTDYEAPTISITQELRFSNREKFSVLDYFTATDVIDGNITDRLIINESDIVSRTAGEYSVSVSVENSRGDKTEMTVPVCIDSYSAYRPHISLSQFITFVKAGTAQPNFASFITSVTAADGTTPIALENVKIDYTTVDMNTPGSYFVTYTVTPEGEISTDTNTAETTLIIVVR